MGKSFQLLPEEVAGVDTKYRKIVTRIPAPDSIPVLEKLRKWEPRSMSGQPPVIWDRAEGVNVFDPYGNKWLDFSSGVLVASAGHGHPKICEAIRKAIEKPLLHNYCFPSVHRAQLAEKIASVSPEPLKKVFLLTTGAEAVECAMKLARTYGTKKKANKKVIVSFEHSFHGRTLGAQMIGGIPELKEWICNLDPDILQVPFPGDPRVNDRSFEVFENTLKKCGVDSGNVCGVISETYQGGSAAFMPKEYAVKLREWCNQYDVLLIFDEIQAGFGRTGTLFGFEHYGISPDIFTLGKGISSGLPLSAVVGRPDILDLYEPGTMTSTHSGNPLCAASSLANIRIILEEKLAENAARMGKVFEKQLAKIKEKFRQVGFVCGKGLVWGIGIVIPDTMKPDGNAAFEIVKKSVQKGLLLFSPVGFKGSVIKVCPPLVIKEEAVMEGCSVLEEAIRDAVK